MAQRDTSKPGFRRPVHERRPRPTAQQRKNAADERRRKAIDRKLDEALIETFPASDPAVSTPRKS